MVSTKLKKKVAQNSFWTGTYYFNRPLQINCGKNRTSCGGCKKMLFFDLVLLLKTRRFNISLQCKLPSLL